MPSLTVDLLVFLLGVALLIAGGESLVRGAVALAGRAGVSTLIVGLTLVAFGTSAPELALNLAAAARGHTDLSFGNVVGSNIANIGLILGLAALLRPVAVHDSIIRRELPLMLIATGVLALLILAPPGTALTEAPPKAISRVDGAVLLGGFGLFLWGMARTMGAGDASAGLAKEAQEAAAAAARPGGALPAAGLTLLGLALLTAGGRFAEAGAIGVAAELGASEALIGLTIVAVATSLPELATSLIAMRRGEADIAVGNVVGSNIFNILLILGVTALVRPVPMPEGGWRALTGAIVFAALLIPITRTHNQRVSRLEGAGLLALYAAMMGLEVWLGV